MLLAVLCLFFISIGVTFASDTGDNKNINDNEINTNTINEEVSDKLNTVNSTSLSIDSNTVYTTNNVNVGTSTTNNINTTSTNNATNTTNTIKTTNTTNNANINSNTNTNINTDLNNTNKSKTTTSNKNLAAAGDIKPTELTQSQILAASNSVYKHINKYNKLPNYVTIAGYKFSMPEFMYLLSKTIVNKYKKIKSSIVVKYDVKNPTKPTGNTIKAKMNSRHYYKYANNVVNYIVKNNKVPNYVSTSWGRMQYQTAIYSFSKLLQWSYHHGSKLPSSLTVKVSKSHKMNKNIPKYTRTVSQPSDSSKSKVPSSILNSKYNGESLTGFLSSSKNCQSDDVTIKSLAKTITKNCKTELEKATAIFNWVRDKVSYSFYYNTKKGAVKTLSSKSGNCVDKTHLLVALMRSSGIAAKYVHGKAKFTSGNTYGHVWAQVLIGDTWVVADTTSSKNSFGVVNNWNAKTATIYGSYSSLSF